MTVSGNGKGGVMAHDPLADLEQDTADAPPEAASEAGEDVPEAAPAADTQAGGISLGDSLTIEEVGELRERLRAGLDLGGTLNIHAAEVEQVDAAGIQLLCAAARDARNQGLDLAWDGVSDRLQAAVRQLGLEGELAF